MADVREIVRGACVAGFAANSATAGNAIIAATYSALSSAQ